MSGRRVKRRRVEGSQDPRRRWLWVAPVLLLAGGYWLLRQPTTAPETERTPSSKAARTSAPRPEHRPEPALRRTARKARPQAARRATSAPTLPAAAAIQVPLVAQPKPAPRTAQLNMQVLQEARKHGWVYTDEGETPCPPQRVKILWDTPGDLSSYDRGAYFEPLGPAPSESSKSVNGLLLCEGYTFLYRGFEAYYDEERGQWRVYPFPVIEPAPGEE